METKDFSLFKYFVKRLKEMGFKASDVNDLDVYPQLLFSKKDVNREFYVKISDYSDYKNASWSPPYIRLSSYKDKYDKKGTEMIYPIDNHYFDVIKPYYELIGITLNLYPTWRSAFNQLVKDYHELTKNAHKRIHKGVSIHET